MAAAIAALLAAAAPTSADQLPTPYPQSVSATGPFYGGVPRYDMCVAPCSFTAFPPTADLDGDPYVFSGNGQWQLGVTLNGEDVDSTPTIVPATGQDLRYVATALGRYTISLLDDIGGEYLSSPFLVVSKADAPAPVKFLSSKTVEIGSLIKVRSPKTKVRVSFARDGAEYATRGRYGTRARTVSCAKKIKNVHCFKVTRLQPRLLPPTQILIFAWNKSVITNTFGYEGVGDRKLVRAKVLNKS